MREHTDENRLSTVCKEARCPNQGACFEKRTATFLILGDLCTRDCRFCAVKHGAPNAVRTDEPERVSSSAAALGLKHVVITSVTRDDLKDGGASHFAATIQAIRRHISGVTVEVLIPDFQGSEEALRAIINARPEVINHNIETVPRLYNSLRRGALYETSIELIRRTRRLSPETIIKSGIMVGLGETDEETLAVVRDLVEAGCHVLTIGQYLRPTPRHHPVHEYLPPEGFERLKERATKEGMPMVVAGPLVRSSYRAAETLAGMTQQKFRDNCF
jgi:lipoic acid synthetase